MKVKYIGGAPLLILEIGEIFDVIDTVEGYMQISAGWFNSIHFEEVK